MKMKKFTAIALSAVMATSAFCCIPAVSAVTSKGKYEDEAARLDQIAYTDNDLGATYTPNGTTFKVWAPTASKVVTNLYTTGSDAEANAEKISSTEMTYDETNGVWSLTVIGDIKNTYYTYSVTVGTSTKETQDVYSKAVGVNGDRSMVVDLDTTDPEGWENDNYVFVPNQTDASIWEVHVKDFSYDENSGVSEANRGKYLAFTETGTTLNGEGNMATGVDYLKELGVKYVQINPFYDYASVREDGSDKQYNWGYDPKNYNVPEGSYSSNPYDGNVRINETKQMIKALHDAGIGVIMDVVYNHTYNTDSSFAKTVPNYYYRYTKTGALSNGSGCGNDTASEHAMYGKFMVDSVKYWADEYHIDGFRFDLMGLHDVDTMNAIRDELDTIDTRILMYGEGWTLSTIPDTTCPPLATQKNASKMSDRIAFFNDQIRDGIKGSVFDEIGKGYIQGNLGSDKDVKAGITANVLGGNWKSLAPTQTVSYASAHDNHTMYDRLIMSMYDASARDFSARYEDLVAMNKLSSAITLSSQGIPFILAGEEMARTKFGDHNSYKSSPEINKIDWDRIAQYQDLVSYYAGMMQLRDNYYLFRDPTNSTASKIKYATSASKNVISYTIQDAQQAWKNVAVNFNSATTPQEVTLAGDSLPTEWVVIVNDKIAGIKNLGEVSGTTVTIPAQSALILVDKASFDEASIPSSKGIVTVVHKNAETGEVMSTSSMSGEIGNYYATAKRDDLALEYDLVATPDNATGTFTSEDITVTYEYEPYKLEPKDITGDGKISIKDIVQINYMTAKVIEDDMTADVDKDGKISINDIYIYQSYISGVELIGISQVVVNYLENGTDKVISSQTILKNRVGAEYKVEPKTISYYEVDDTKLPTNAEGKFAMKTTEVNYYYNFAATTRTVNVKLMDGQTWTPNLYGWYTDASTGKTDQMLGAWPGKPMELGEDGWYTLTFACGGIYNFIINTGSAQTIDLTGYDSDVWVVMNRPKPIKDDGDCTIYTEKPVL